MVCGAALTTEEFSMFRIDRFLLVTALIFSTTHAEETWKRHTIDNTSRGADGVRIGDLNQDGLPDLVTGWEEGGVVRVYEHPGFDFVTKPWPKQTVGDVKKAEDAVFVDLDHDGLLDVVSSCEGNIRTAYVHWNRGKKWETAPIPALAGRAMWMFISPMTVQSPGVDLVCAAKGPGAEIGWLASPSDPSELADWTWHPLAQVGWVMSVIIRDMDGDGDLDILYTDRKGGQRGVHWLEFDTSQDLQKPWPRHTVGGVDREVMFMTTGDVDGDNVEDLVVAVKDGPITWYSRASETSDIWTEHEIQMPPNSGSGKGVAVLDVDHDGHQDVVFSCEHSENKHGMGWLQAPEGDTSQREWIFHPITGSAKGSGVKFDLLQKLDLDNDGDLDVITCEERDNLGVIWYENPTK